MARIRSIKPDAFKSESLSSVPREVRWTFAGLWTYCDDEGRGVDNHRLIWAELYPLDDDVSPDDVEADLKALESIGAIVRYEVDGRKLLAIPAFAKHQASAYRRTPSQIPAPPGMEVHELSRNSVKKSASSREGIEREGEDQTADADERSRKEDRFAEFWTAYARKVGRGQAIKAWRAAIKKAEPDAIITAASEFTAWHRAEGTEPRFIPHPATWLNGERWADEKSSRAADRQTAHVTETPPDGLTSEEYRSWYDAALERAKAAAS